MFNIREEYTEEIHKMIKEWFVEDRSEPFFKIEGEFIKSFSFLKIGSNNSLYIKYNTKNNSSSSSISKEDFLELSYEDMCKCFKKPYQDIQNGYYIELNSWSFKNKARDNRIKNDPNELIKEKKEEIKKLEKVLYANEKLKKNWEKEIAELQNAIENNEKRNVDIKGRIKKLQEELKE